MTFNYKRLKMFNYYNGGYQEIDYNYIDGILIYDCKGLGSLVIAQEDYDFRLLFIILSVVLTFVLASILIVVNVNKNKINKYKSLKRRKDYGDCL